MSVRDYCWDYKQEYIRTNNRCPDTIELTPAEFQALKDEGGWLFRSNIKETATIYGMEILIVDRPKNRKTDCNCDMTVLMNRGCQCGAIRAERSDDATMRFGAGGIVPAPSEPDNSIVVLDPEFLANQQFVIQDNWATILKRFENNLSAKPVRHNDDE